MAPLSERTRDELVAALLNVPRMTSAAGRDALLSGSVPRLVALGFNRDPANTLNDVELIVSQLDGLRRLVPSGERPLIAFASRARRSVEGTEIARLLDELIAAVDRDFAGDEPSSPPMESRLGGDEALVFAEDARVPHSFIERAQAAAQGVARLAVSSRRPGSSERRWSFGTGWLIGEDILITNHHVLAAVKAGEPSPSPAALQEQALGMTVWFDYHLEGGDRVEVKTAGLLHDDAELDFALIELAKRDAGRARLRMAMPETTLVKGERLNIIQYPRGGELRFAIRNNFYVGIGDTKDHIRYLTDTEPGASGSPVLNDDWQVVALHHAYRPVEPHLFKDEKIRYHNQGIDIRAILQRMPADIRDLVLRRAPEPS